MPRKKPKGNSGVYTTANDIEGKNHSYTTGEEMDPYINLSNAIVFQAVQDYRKAVDDIEAEPFNYMAKKGHYPN